MKKNKIKIVLKFHENSSRFLYILLSFEDTNSVIKNRRRNLIMSKNDYNENNQNNSQNQQNNNRNQSQNKSGNCSNDNNNNNRNQKNNEF